MIILGISCYYHDSAACLIKDGEIIAAVEEERFSRVKHDQSFPVQSVNYCLNYLSISIGEVDAIVFYDKPILKFDRILETHFAYAPFSCAGFVKSLSAWLGEKLFFRRNIMASLDLSSLKAPPIYYSEHHLSHAASAFYPSPFEKAAVLCVDGVGEWASTSGWIGHKETLSPIFEIEYPHSLGLFYSSFTAYLGFKVNSGEYKLMGLAPLGEPIYRDILLEEVIALLTDGSYQLNLKYFNFSSTKQMFTDELIKLFGHKPRKSEEPITDFHKNLAASVQLVLEESLVALAQALKAKTDCDSLVLAGGVALNCVANSKLKTIFPKIWIQPASGDSGGSLGAALAFYYIHSKAKRTNLTENSMRGALLGPSYTEENIKSILDYYGFNYLEFSNRSEVNEVIALELEDKKIIALFQGRMEFGPRSLGSRSIIADARNIEMKSLLNQKIKKRESFRPFAPSILKEHVETYFEWPQSESSPFMLFTANSKFPEKIPSATHVDGSSRIQIVDKSIHKNFHELLSTFYNKTRCPLVLNTSFNVRGEPIVQSPLDALNAFMTTDIDVLVIENYILFKNEQPQKILEFDWKDAYQND